VDFKELLRMTQRRWLTIVVFVLLGLLASGAITYFQTPKYESRARVFISTKVSSSNSADAFAASYFATQRVQSYAQLATSRELMQRVTSKLNLNMTPSALAAKITAEVSDQTVIIVDPATYNASPVSPQPVFNLAIGLVLGLVIGVGLALIRDLLDNTVSSTSDVESSIDAPVLASIAFEADVPKHPLLTEAAGHSTRVEAFRLLRTNLQFLDLDTRPRALVITSAVPGEGKTSTAANLAIALAQTGQRVLLVDGDLRRPKLASLLGLERSVGLTTVLVGRSDLTESIQKHSGSGIYFLASGPLPPNPTEVLQSKTAQALFDRLSEMFDMVIIDGPPLLPVSDSAIMARDADGAILVVRHGKTTKEQLRQAATRLSQVDADIFGVTINMAPKRGIKPYGYDYAYGYGPEKHKS
jgi:capsular exopolysaccharide synthesis family protein